MQIENLKQKVWNGEAISEDEALWLANEADKTLLYESAHEITRHFMGDKFDLCSIINAKSGNCSEDCKWCAQSVHYPTAADIYPLLPAEECVEQAVYNASKGVRRFSLVTSGKRVTPGDLQEITDIVRQIRKACPIHCCASMGLLKADDLGKLREAGVENYHCNLESAPSYFPKLCSTHTTAQKLATLRLARVAGLRLCSGGIIGMGESMAQRIEMARVLHAEGIRSIPLNLLHPIPGTPLEHAAPLSADELLTTIALFRWINPEAFLRFAGGRRQLPEWVQRKALYVGINSAITGDLLTTGGCSIEADKAMIAEAGYSLEENIDW